MNIRTTKLTAIIIIIAIAITFISLYLYDQYQLNKYTKLCAFNHNFCFKLAKIYDESKRQNKNEALEFYKKSCDDGNAKGCNNLGTMYELADGVNKDNYMAKTLYERGCNMGAVKACFNLGVMYELGKGVRQDKNKAMEIFMMACKMGNIRACERNQEDKNDGIDEIIKTNKTDKTNKTRWQ